MNLNRWKRWSLPSKLTVIGTIVGIISLLITLILFFIKDNYRKEIISKETNSSVQKNPIRNSKPFISNAEQSTTETLIGNIAIKENSNSHLNLTIQYPLQNQLHQNSDTILRLEPIDIMGIEITNKFSLIMDTSESTFNSESLSSENKVDYKINSEIIELVDILNGNAELIRLAFDVNVNMNKDLNRPDSVKKFEILRKDFERLHKEVINALKMNNFTLYHQLFNDMTEFLRTTFPGGSPGIAPKYKDE
jgi:hypothetical protein